MKRDEKIDYIKYVKQEYDKLTKLRKDFFDNLAKVCKNNDDLGASIINNDNSKSLRLKFFDDEFIIESSIINSSGYKCRFSFKKIINEKNYEIHENLGNDIILDTFGNLTITNTEEELPAHITDNYSVDTILSIWHYN